MKKFINKLTQAKSKDKNIARRELVLNILLVASVGCFLALNIIRIIDVVGNPQDRGLPIIYTLLILAFFLFLMYLSKKGWIKTASLLLIFIYALPTFYSFILWGADLPAALLLTVLLITMSGALIGARFAVINTVIMGTFLILLTYLQEKEMIIVQSYWRSEQHTVGDAIVYTILFLVISTVAWIFCHELQKALRRARQSEQKLKEERDELELRVIKRTKQLRQVEAEKINQLYRLAEFGRLSSGIFHDLINPLTAISLNLEQIHDKEYKVANTKTYLSQALTATRKMEDLIASIKNQIQRKHNLKYFSLNEEIRQTIQILSYKARKANVKIFFTNQQQFSLHGDAVKFGQIITNLICNAIEACEETAGDNKKVSIEMETQSGKIIVTISDNGCGVEGDTSQIFEPFFSTKKKDNRGLGLGLSSTKHIVENDFKGTIQIEISHKTKFIISLPLNNA